LRFFPGQFQLRQRAQRPRQCNRRLAAGLITLLCRDNCLPNRDHGSNRDRCDACPYEQAVAAMLANVGAVEFILADAANRRPDVQHRLAES
jgi:hypothetical protein